LGNSRDRSHVDVQAAGTDESEGAKVRVNVERDTVPADTRPHGDTDKGELRIVHPEAVIPWVALSRHAEGGRGYEKGLLQPPDEGRDVGSELTNGRDDVCDELAWPVEGRPSTALAGAQANASLLELGRADQQIRMCVAATKCHDGVMLEEQKRRRRDPITNALSNVQLELVRYVVTYPSEPLGV
jgi:hypothetical protein